MYAILCYILGRGDKSTFPPLHYGKLQSKDLNLTVATSAILPTFVNFISVKFLASLQLKANNEILYIFSSL